MSASTEKSVHRSLSEDHCKTLLSKAVDPKVAEAVGVYSAKTPADLPPGSPASWNDLLPAIMYPWHDGVDVEWQICPPDDKKPIDANGDEIKYLFAKDAMVRLSKVRENEDGGPVLICEGSKQHLAVLSVAPAKYSVYGVSGCWNWGGMDLSFVDGREAIVVFDGDMTKNFHVWDAADRLRETLELNGAEAVKFAKVPVSRGNGIDDYLGKVAADKRSDHLDRMATRAKKSIGTRPSAKMTKATTAADSYMKYFDDEGRLLVATLVRDINRDHPLMLSATTEMNRVALYRNGCYRVLETAFTGAVTEKLTERFSKNSRVNSEEYAIGMLYNKDMVLPLHAERPLLNVANGMVDLVNGVMLEHDKKYRSWSQLPVNYDPDATCPTYDAWVVKMCPEQVEDLEEVFSMVLDPSRTPQRAAFLYGPTRSGKSTYMRLMAALVGKEGVSAVALDKLAVSTGFPAAHLFGKILNSANDISSSYVPDISEFKKMTGEDLLYGNRKYGKDFHFTNKALFAFSANDIPAVHDPSGAYLARMKPFEFPNSFAGHEDPTIEDMMMLELPGILNRLIAAWRRRLDRGHWIETLPRVQAHFEARTDRVRQWISEECTIVQTLPDGTAVGHNTVMPAGQWNTVRSLFHSFNEWANTVGGKDMGEQAVSDRLRAMKGVHEVRGPRPARTRGLNIIVSQAGGGDDNPFTVPDKGSGQTGPSSTNSVQGQDTDSDQLGQTGLSSLKKIHEKKTLVGVEGESTRVLPLSIYGDTPPHLPQPQLSEVVSSPSFTQIGRARAWSVADPESIELLFRSLSAHPRDLALDVETTGLDFSCLKVRTVQIAWDTSCVVIVTEDADGNEDKAAVQAVKDGLPLLTQRVWTYGDFDARALDAHVGVALVAANAMALHHLVDPFTASNSDPLKTAIKKTLGWTPSPLKAEKTLALPTDDEEFLKYAALDALGTLALVKQWLPTVESDRGWSEQVTPWLEREARILEVTRVMSNNGMLVDPVETMRLRDSYQEQQQAAAETIEALAPGLNPGSPKQVIAVLTERGMTLKDKRRKRNDGSTYRSPNTTGDALRLLDDPLATAIADTRSNKSRVDTLEAWLEHTGADGRIHARFNPLGTRTSRWSSSGPNLQNVPKRNEGIVMRGGIVAAPGKTIVQADLSQIEYRIAAALSGDPAMIAAYLEEGDLHIIAARVLGGTDDPTKDDRAAAKAIGFGKLYGQTPKTYAENNGLTESEANRRVALYDATFPRLKTWSDEVSGHFNRTKFTPRNPYLRRFQPPSPHMAVNYLVQSTAREVFCDWLLLVASRYEGQVIGAIHDEILLEVDEAEGAAAAQWCRDAALLIRPEWLGEVRIVAEAIDAGHRWLDAY